MKITFFFNSLFSSSPQRQWAAGLHELRRLLPHGAGQGEPKWTRSLPKRIPAWRLPLVFRSRLRFVCSSVGPWTFRVQLGVREFEWPQYSGVGGGGNTLRSAVSLLSPADTGATTALSVSPSQLKRHGSHTSPLYYFTVSLQKFTLRFYHVAHKTFVTLTGVTLEKSGVFWRRKMSRWQTLCCCNLLCCLLSGNNKDLSRSSLSSAPALEPSESQHILFSSRVARIAAVSRGLWLYRWQQCTVSCPRAFHPFRQITDQRYLLPHVDLFKILF